MKKLLVCLMCLFIGACSGMQPKDSGDILNGGVESKLKNNKICPEEYIEILAIIVDEEGNSVALVDLDCDLICDMGIISNSDNIPVFMVSCEVGYYLIEEYKKYLNEGKEKL